MDASHFAFTSGRCQASSIEEGVWARAAGERPGASQRRIGVPRKPIPVPSHSVITGLANISVSSEIGKTSKKIELLSTLKQTCRLFAILGGTWENGGRT